MEYTFLLTILTTGTNVILVETFLCKKALHLYENHFAPYEIFKLYKI